jgi:hypothetical protein
MSGLLPFLHIFSLNTACAPKTFFLLPSWYEYLYRAGRIDYQGNSQVCQLVGPIQWPGDVVLIGIALLDLGLRIAGMLAVAYVVWGGIQYVTSQGEPDKTKKAQETIINALIGMVLATMATAIVAFIGREIGKT